MGKLVTDPALLAELNGQSPQIPVKPKAVTDQALLAELNAATPTPVPVSATQSVDPNAPSPLGSFARGVVHGGMANFDDEVAGAGWAIGTAINKAPTALQKAVLRYGRAFTDAKDKGIGQAASDLYKDAWSGTIEGAKELGNAYSTVRDAVRGVQKQDEATNPYSYLAGQGVGAVATALTPAGGSGLVANIGKSAVTPLGKMVAATARNGLQGAGMGGVYGAGTGEGLQDTAEQGIFGTLLGGGAGAALTPLASMIGKGYEIGRNLISPGAKAAKITGQEVADALVADGMSATAAEAAAKQWASKGSNVADLEAMASMATNELAQTNPSNNLANLARSQDIDINKVTQNKLLDAIRADKMTPDDLLAKLNDDTSMGVDSALLDLGGANVRSLARTPYTLPGPGKQIVNKFLDERVEAQAQNIDAAIRKVISKNDDFYGTAEDIVKQRSEKARPLYKKAEEAGTMWSPGLASLMERPSIVKAYGKARDMAAEEGVTLPQLKFTDQGKPDPESLKQLSKSMTTREWDFVKKSLDDTLNSSSSGHKNPITGKVLTNEGRQINNTRMALLDELDNLNEYYRDARSVFAGESDLLDALKLGREFSKGDTEIVARQIAKMSPSEKEMFRAGIARNLQDTMANTVDGGDVLKKLTGKPMMREKLKMAFDNDDRAYTEFMRQMNRRQELYKNNQLIRGNSNTAEKLSEVNKFQNDMAGEIGETVRNIKDGNWANVAKPAISGALNYAGKKAMGLSDQVLEQLATHMYNGDSGSIRPLLMNLSRAEKAQALKEAQARMVSSGRTGLTASELNELLD